MNEDIKEIRTVIITIIFAIITGVIIDFVVAEKAHGANNSHGNISGATATGEDNKWKI